MSKKTQQSRESRDLHHYTTIGNIDGVSRAIEAGADVDAKQHEEGFTPLWRAAARGGCYKIIEMLLENGADPNLKTTSGDSPFLACCSTGEIKTLELLLKFKANINDYDSHRNGGLHIAVGEKNKSLIEFLLKKGAKPNIKDDQGLTPLHLAVLEEDEEACLLLLEHGANPSIKNKEGETAYDIGESNNCSRIIQRYIVKKKAEKLFREIDL
jgi:ankyrin repeat protein